MMRRTMSRLYLRLPVSKKEFMEKFNTTPEKVFPKQIEKLKAEGLLETDDNEVRLTKKGELWKGNIAWEFAPQAKARLFPLSFLRYRLVWSFNF